MSQSAPAIQQALAELTAPSISWENARSDPYFFTPESFRDPLTTLQGDRSALYSTQVRRASGCNDYDGRMSADTAGIANYPNDGDTVEELIARADQRLYKGKERGRNRVMYDTVIMKALTTS